MLELRQYSIQDIKEEVRTLLAKGAVGQQNPIYELAKYFGYCEWLSIEQLLEHNDYLLRDNIIDLVGKEA